MDIGYLKKNKIKADSPTYIGNLLKEVGKINSRFSFAVYFYTNIPEVCSDIGGILFLLSLLLSCCVKYTFLFFIVFFVKVPVKISFSYCSDCLPKLKGLGKNKQR